MVLAVVVFAALVVVAKAGVLAPASLAASPILRAAPIAAAPIAKAVAVADADFDPNPQYSYAYDIQDSLTGDSKNHVESRNGDVVQGQYSLIDPDGTRRIVDYTADPINGFNAVVHKEALTVKTIAKIATPLVHNKVIY